VPAAVLGARVATPKTVGKTPGKTPKGGTAAAKHSPVDTKPPPAMAQQVTSIVIT
jgi:hypothetical protein